VSETNYYIRLRGRVSGPFELASLQAMARRGTLSRIHELSSDGVSWSSAGTMAELFAQPTAGAPPAQAEVREPVVPQVEPPPIVPPVRKYFYRQGGRTFGPVPLPILQSLARAGKLSPEADVWRPDDKKPIVARLLAELRFKKTFAIANEPVPMEIEASPPRSRLTLALLAALPLLLAALIALLLHWRSEVLSARPPVSPVNHAADR